MTVALPPWEMRPLAAERYRALGTQTIDDAPDWYLASLTDAQAAMWDHLELVARPQADGRDGWDVASDPAACPDEWLPWAAQFGGVAVAPESLIGASEAFVAAERARAVERPALYTGLTATILAIVRAHLRDGATAPVPRERYDPAAPAADSAYHLTVEVRAEDIVGTTAALTTIFEATLPGGIKGHLVVVDGMRWRDVLDNHPSWQDVLDEHTSWTDLIEEG